jgi:DNA topoisomerase-3
LREGRDLVPTAKAFQLMTLLRGLGVQDLSRAELTGEWEYKLAQMEKGLMSRDQFMQEIAAMTERMVQRAKEYDRDNIPGDYATLSAPCPHCGGIVRENYRRYTCTGQDGASQGCGFSFTKIPAGRAFEIQEVEAFLQNKRIGPLEGFRSKAGWPFVAELALVPDNETRNWKLEFDFGDKGSDSETGELAEFTGEALGACPNCGAGVFAHGTQYVCEKAVPSAKQVTPSCSFKSGKTILQQAIEAAQMQKLLSTGKTDLLENFVSMRTRRNFKAFLVWDAKEKKVAFEFETKEGANGKTRSYPRKTTTKAASTKTTAKTASAKSTPTKKVARKTAKP